MKADPTLNIWQASERLVLPSGKGEVVINRRELLFLIDSNSKNFIFKTEDENIVRIPIKAVKEKKIILLFCSELLQDETK